MRALLATVAVLAAVTAPGSAIAQDDGGPRYELDPVVDGSISAMALGLALFSELTIHSGELLPQEPESTGRLLGVDRWIAERDGPIWSQSRAASTLAVGVLMGYGVLDAALAGADDAGQGLVLVALYVESTILNWALANLAKLAVRRPRPEAYAQMRNGTPPEATDTALSFYSGHTAIAAGLASTASYLAWARAPGSVEAWLTIGVGAALTAFVAAQRVLAQAHFPTDVAAGMLFGSGVGLLVPHLHRADPTDRWSVVPFIDGEATGVVLQRPL